MALVFSTVEVEDYSKWRAVFDAGETVRKEYGVSATGVYQDTSNPNRITVTVEGDLSDLQAFYGSEELKAFMADAGVLGPPTPLFVNEVT